MIGAKHLLEFPGVRLLLSHGPEGETNDGPTQSPSPTVYESLVDTKNDRNRQILDQSWHRKK